MLTQLHLEALQDDMMKVMMLLLSGCRGQQACYLSSSSRTSCSLAMKAVEAWI